MKNAIKKYFNYPGQISPGGAPIVSVSCKNILVHNDDVVFPHEAAALDELCRDGIDDMESAELLWLLKQSPAFGVEHSSYSSSKTSIHASGMTSSGILRSCRKLQR